jgi:phosphatidylinositol alpha-1,6-mannosyltransferase
MSIERCLLITTHYLPLVGGAQTVYDALASSAPDQFHILTARHDHETGNVIDECDVFDASVAYSITRLDHMRLNIMRSPPSVRGRFRAFWASRRIEHKVLAEIQEICERENITTICIGLSVGLVKLVPSLKKTMKQAIVIYTHGEEVSQKAYSWLSGRYRRRALELADGIVAVSGFTKKLLIDRFSLDAEKIRLVQNGVDYARFSEPQNIDIKSLYNIEPGPLVVATGRMVARKGFDKLLEAWPEIVQAIPKAKLVLAGAGPLTENLRKQILELKIAQSVHQLGYLPEQHLVAMYQKADLFCMPNRTMPDGDTEGFGLVFLEAAAAGTPSVGGTAGGAIDAIIDQKTGLQVDGESTSEIAAAVIELLQNKERRNEMAVAAKAHALQNVWHAKTKELLAFFSEIHTRLN